LEGGEIELVHPKHGVEHTLRLLRIVLAQHLSEETRDDLPEVTIFWLFG
jgi:hypothetical protein